MTKEIADNELINDSLSQNPFPAWLWLALVAALAALLWGGGSWLFMKRSEWVKDSPFLKVTNRDFSLFLWQNPEYMRANVSSKTGYLPGFEYKDKITIIPGQAEQYVSAPPGVLFLYHVWHRLLGKTFPKRAISVNEFKAFLDYNTEWQPANWPNAPKGYREVVEKVSYETGNRLLLDLPREVQQAFIGWKNYFMEGESINHIRPTYAQLRLFLSDFPHYARNYWRNIVSSGRPDYLQSFGDKNKGEEEIVPENELTGFLKVALFNFEQAQKGL
ncbi:MAG: hypothetical protein ACSNEK_05585 [Parachlamydiaceae bacterium]